MGIAAFDQSSGRDLLVFLSYGSESRQVSETSFGVLSAVHAIGSDDIDLLLYTDHPGLFSELDVPLRTISGAELEQWSGPHDYTHRIKTAVLREALARDATRVVLVDSDTWFIKPARMLFDRVQPGHSVMHVFEGPLRSNSYDFNKRLADVTTGRLLRSARGEVWSIGDDPGLWNSGVVGVHAADAAAVDDALALIDVLLEEGVRSFTLEQFATGAALGAGTVINSSLDVVYHYWDAAIRAEFASRAPMLLDRALSARGHRRRLLHRGRPRARGVIRVKQLVRLWINRLGGRTTTTPSSFT